MPVNGVDDVAEFNQTSEAMLVMGLSQDDVNGKLKLKIIFSALQTSNILLSLFECKFCIIRIVNLPVKINIFICLKVYLADINFIS